jgi:hypothetical protein
VDSENIALVAKALLEIAEPPTAGNAIWITRPSMHDSVCARTLLCNTIGEAEQADVDEIARLVRETLERNSGIEEWVRNLLEMDQGYRKLKGFLWLSMRYAANAAH